VGAAPQTREKVVCASGWGVRTFRPLKGQLQRCAVAAALLHLLYLHALVPSFLLFLPI